METDNTTTWVIATAIATLGTAMAAATSAVVAAYALRSQARALDVSSYLTILERLQRFERRIQDFGSDENERTFTLREYANFLEGVAHLYNKGRFGSRTADHCRDALANSVAAIEINSDVMEILARSITSLETFEHLGAFKKKYKDLVDQRKDVFREQAKITLHV